MSITIRSKTQTCDENINGIVWLKLSFIKIQDAVDVIQDEP